MQQSIARGSRRAIDIADFMPPTWDQVRHRAYDAWHGDHVVIDTAGQTLHQSVAALERALASR